VGLEEVIGLLETGMCVGSNVGLVEEVGCLDVEGEAVEGNLLGPSVDGGNKSKVGVGCLVGLVIGLWLAGLEDTGRRVGDSDGELGIVVGDEEVGPAVSNCSV